MILSNGNNQFQGQFSFWEWSAPILQTPEELAEALRALRLEGRAVKNLYCIGMAYNWREDDIGDALLGEHSEVDDMPCGRKARGQGKYPRKFEGRRVRAFLRLQGQGG